MRWLVLAVPIILSACGQAEDPAKPSTAAPVPPAAVEKAKDPVCGMYVNKATALKAEVDNAHFYFCAEECLKKFQADPGKYARACVCAKTKARCDCEHCGKSGSLCDCK